VLDRIKHILSILINEGFGETKEKAQFLLKDIEGSGHLDNEYLVEIKSMVKSHVRAIELVEDMELILSKR
jgi:uncharacterized protein YnzC (UPF0291/DUF896 family)